MRFALSMHELAEDLLTEICRTEYGLGIVIFLLISDMSLSLS